MRVVVAGGRGFIGGHLVAALAAHGVDAVAAGEGEVADALEPPSPVVVWSAGIRCDDAAVMQEQHVDAPVIAMRTARDLECFVYFSSAAVYGDAPVPFAVGTERVPEQPYARAKIDGERALASQAAQLGVKLVVLRLAVVYGPGQAGPMFIPALLDHLRSGRPFELTGGEQTRDFVYVDDVVAATQLALATDAPAGTFNVGSGRETRLRDAAQIACDELGADPALLRWGAVPYRDNEQMRYVLDLQASHDQLGYAPAVDLRAGIRRIVRV